jgi:hypothetical protein
VHVKLPATKLQPCAPRNWALEINIHQHSTFTQPYFHPILANSALSGLSVTAMGLKLFQASSPDPIREPTKHDDGNPSDNLSISILISDDEDEPIEPGYLRDRILELQTTLNSMNALVRSRAPSRGLGVNRPVPPLVTADTIAFNSFSTLLRPSQPSRGLDGNHPVRPPATAATMLDGPTDEHLYKTRDSHINIFSRSGSRPEPLDHGPPSPAHIFLSSSDFRDLELSPDGTEITTTSANEE